MLQNPFPNKYKAIPKEIYQYTDIVHLMLSIWGFSCFVILFFLQEIALEISNQSWFGNLHWKFPTHEHPIFTVSKIKTQLHHQTQWLYEQEYRFGTKDEWLYRECLIDPTPILTKEILECEIEVPILKPQHALIIGASSIQSSFGAQLSQLLQQKSQIQTTRLGKIGTGLSRPDVFDWTVETQNILNNQDIDLVVVQFIGNDHQSIVDKQQNIIAAINSTKWAEEYAKRWQEWIDNILEFDVDIVILGMPNVRLNLYSRNLHKLNLLVQDIALQNNIPFLSLWEISTQNDSVRESIRMNGRTYKFKHDDGIHFSHMGAKITAQYVHDELEEIYHWNEHQVEIKTAN